MTTLYPRGLNVNISQKALTVDRVHMAWKCAHLFNDKPISARGGGYYGTFVTDSHQLCAILRKGQHNKSPSSHHFFGPEQLVTPPMPVATLAQAALSQGRSQQSHQAARFIFPPYLAYHCYIPASLDPTFVSIHHDGYLERFASIPKPNHQVRFGQSS